MKLAALGLLLFVGLLSFPTRAQVYRCTKNGAVTYQQTPCEAADGRSSERLDTVRSLNGCYAASLDTIYRVRVRTVGLGAVEMIIDNEAGQGKPVPPFRMKRATADELRALGTTFGLVLREGVSLEGNAQSVANYKPVGMYLGKDKAGEDVILAYFF